MAKEIKEKFVKIQSSVNITVSPGLQCQDNTNESAHVPERLRVNPTWTKCMIEIKVGPHWYPSEIALWPSVLSLEKDGLLTIGKFSDTPDEDVNRIDFDNNISEMNDMTDSNIPVLKKEEKKYRELKNIAGEDK